MRTIASLAALGAVGLMTGCTSGNGALQPPFTSVSLTASKVQLAVGVATFTDGSKGLNVVETARQPDGLSAALVNTPTITGPFTVPTATAAGTDAGTNHISATPQTLPGTTAVVTTFGQSGGAFAYGFAPENSTTAGAATYTAYSQAFYGARALTGNQTISNVGVPYLGGPPAYPNVRNGTFPAGFNGYPLGATTFALTPVVGAYNLSVLIASGNTSGATLASNTATLANATGLPAFAAAPTFAADGAGGGTATCVAPVGTTETIVEFIDLTAAGSNLATAPVDYTVVVQGGGAVTATLGDNLGPALPNATSATFPAGDDVQVECIAADYPLFEAGPPANTSQTPTLLGAAGQADLSFSPPLLTTI